MALTTTTMTNSSNNSKQRKDVKKQSYYVWFLGAKESKGLRGKEYIEPVLKDLLDQERKLEPTKVTLQVSSKGLKIIQNVSRRSSNKNKAEQIKHSIPHHAITCVSQEPKPDDDIVSCILLLYNPLTKCPVHVHSYRCDSVETATNLSHQLQLLIDRPENQKKFREIENRLAAKGLIVSNGSGGDGGGGGSNLGGGSNMRARRSNSDGRSVHTDGSDRTPEDADSGGSEKDVPPAVPAPVVRKDKHIASLYDSLAAELRQRLGSNSAGPILLPPKDYDTISRKRGKLKGIDNRGSTNTQIVGAVKTTVTARGSQSSSGKSSSGIGSDEALSSAIQEVSSHPDFEGKEVADPNTSSESEDYDWPEPLPEDDEVIPTEWRRAPPRSKFNNNQQSVPLPPMQQQRHSTNNKSNNHKNSARTPSPMRKNQHSNHVVKNGVSPQNSNNSRVKQHQIEPAPAVDKERRSGKEQKTTSRTSPDGRRERFQEYTGDQEKKKIQQPQAVVPPPVIQQQHHRPLENHQNNGSNRSNEDRRGERNHRNPHHHTSRPVSYPSGPSPPPKSLTPPPPQPSYERPCHYGCQQDRARPYYDAGGRPEYPPEHYMTRRGQHPPPHCGGYVSQPPPPPPPPPSRGYVIQPPPTGRYFADGRRELEYPPPHPQHYQEQYYPQQRYIEEPPRPTGRRSSGYFDLPVEPRDYRHSFVESPYRRLPLSSHY